MPRECEMSHAMDVADHMVKLVMGNTFIAVIVDNDSLSHFRGHIQYILLVFFCCNLNDHQYIAHPASSGCLLTHFETVLT